MSAPNADYSADLRINAASIDLAQALHDARREAFIGGMLEFYELPPRIRRAYIETAAAVLRATKPDQGLPDDVQIGPLVARAQMRVINGGR